jgi:hypothetical protein
VRILLLVVSVTLAPCAAATVLGGSNLGLMDDYPNPKCMKPIKPSKPYRFNSEWERDLYNEEVDSYNAERRVYVRCIERYIDNADNDIERIREKVKKVIDDANQPQL